MKILYISPENTVGTLPLWKKAHETRGNECRIVTLYKTAYQPDDGICLNVPLVAANPAYMKTRHKYYQRTRGPRGDYREKSGYPPTWEPDSTAEQWYFRFRDWLWHFRIEPAIERYNLQNYDIYHFEWGLDLYRDGRFAKKMAAAGKPIACTYHGQDMRTRGVIPVMDSLSQLNLTSELDLLEKHPAIRYLFLPFDTERFIPEFPLRSPIRVCHSPTDRYYKGSEDIIPICEKLADEGLIEFILIEGRPYREVLELKQSCDILIDQVHNRGGWGYGMNSVEALAMGLVCITELVLAYQAFIPDHPFVAVTADTLEASLRYLLANPAQILERKAAGRDWVKKYHDTRATADVLYGYYEDLGWL